MARLRVRIELNRRMAGVPLDKMASVVEETRKFFYLLAEDVHIEAERGEWLASDFDAESLNFTAEYAGAVSPQQAQAFGAAFSGATSLRRATIAQFTRIAEFLGEDELVGFGLYQNDQEPEPTEWRCLSKRDAMRFGDEIKLLAEAAGEQAPETQLPAVMNGSVAGRRLFKDRREREALAADPTKFVRDMESNLSRRIGVLEGEVAEQTRRMQQISSHPDQAEERFQKLLSAMETFWAQAPRQFPLLAASQTMAAPQTMPAPAALAVAERPQVAEAAAALAQIPVVAPAPIAEAPPVVEAAVAVEMPAIIEVPPVIDAGLPAEARTLTETTPAADAPAVVEASPVAAVPPVVEAPAPSEAPARIGVKTEASAPIVLAPPAEPRGWSVLGVTFAAAAAILIGLSFPTMQQQWMRFASVEILPMARPKPPAAPVLRAPAAPVPAPRPQAETPVRASEVRTVAARSSEPFIGPLIPLEIPAKVKSKIQSEVRVDVVVAIDQEGNVTGAHITSTKGEKARLLETEALRAARQSRFRPAREGEKTVPSEMTLTFLFKPESNEF
jgi:TonB family protein